MIYISVHLVSIYTLTFSNVLLVLTLNLKVHKSSYCKCSLAWCQPRTFLLFTIWTHPLQIREYPFQYVSTDKNKKSHYNSVFTLILKIYNFPEQALKLLNRIDHSHIVLIYRRSERVGPFTRICRPDRNGNESCPGRNCQQMQMYGTRVKENFRKYSLSERVSC